MREVGTNASPGRTDHMAAEAGKARAQQRQHLRAVEGSEGRVGDLRHLRDGRVRRRAEQYRQDDTLPDAPADQGARPTVARTPSVPVFASFRSKKFSTAASTVTAFAQRIM